MSSKTLWLAAACALLSARMALGQTDSPPTSQRSFAARADRQVSPAQMYEDIEVMRRLLDRSLLSLPGVWSSPAHTQAAAFSPDGKVLATTGGEGKVRLWDAVTGKQLADYHHGQAHGPVFVRLAEGVYLPGQGVVFSVNLPLHFQDLVTEPGKATPKPLSDWERTRKELQGDKVEAVAKERERRETSVADAVLKVFAENGRHFTQLAANENLTVAITLRATSQECAQCHGALARAASGAGMMGAGTSGAGGGMGPAMGSMGSSAPMMGRPASNALPSPGQGGGGGGGSGKVGIFSSGPRPPSVKERDEMEADVATRKAEARKQLLVGDLHMKQGGVRSAVDAYQAALEGYYGADVLRKQSQRNSGGRGVKDVQTELQIVEAATKLAQAYLALNESDKALKVLKIIADHFQSAGQTDLPTKPGEERAKIMLPAKLIVSASKQQLDQVASGKISFEEFKKAASVQYLTFPAATKDPKVNPPAAGKTP